MRVGHYYLVTEKNNFEILKAISLPLNEYSTIMKIVDADFVGFNTTSRRYYISETDKNVVHLGDTFIPIETLKESNPEYFI